MESTENSLGTFLTNDFGDRYLYSVNRNAFNRIGSDALYRSHFGEQLFQEYQLNVIIGTDSGILPNFIAKNGVPIGARYLFVELPEVIDVLAGEGMLEDLPREICVIPPESLAEQCRTYNIADYVFLDAVHVQESIAASDANIPDYRTLSWSVNHEIRTTIRATWTSSNASHFILRQLENLTENQVCFSEVLKDAFPGRTAVILAGGPSLKSALPWVKENRDRLVVIAVSRISRILLDEGVVPHIITSVDPQKISFEVSREMLQFPRRSDEVPLFIYSNHASPPLVGQWDGRSVYTGPRFPWQTPLNVDTLAYSGPTVSNYAVSVAVHMGCRAIVLAGVDLCFSADGQTHAAGSNENKVGPDLGQMGLRIETYGGGKADTNQGYAESLNMLGLQAAAAAEKGCRLYNCSLNAAKVSGIDYQAVEEIELSKDEFFPAEVIARLVPESTAASRLAHYKKIRKELDRARSKFQQILTLCHEAIECADGLFGRNGRKRDFCHKIRMDKIERRLDRSFRDFSGLVHQFGLKKFRASLKPTMDEMTDEQVESATYEYYEAYLEGTDYVIKVMESVQARIDARLEEQKESPDFVKLVTQWAKDEQFGRLSIWQRRNPAAARQLSPAEQELVKELEAEFARVMTVERTSQIELLERLHDVKHTRSKALLLYRRGETEELEAMARGLAGHPDQEKALPYLHFVNGLLAEMRDEPTEAVDCYQDLLTEPLHTLAEDALLQIANLSIAVNDIDNALLAVECLVGISPSYLPPYGELLNVLGRYDEAFNAFNRYLAIAPDDVGNMISLGILCKEAGLVDTARELFGRVLEKDPMNKAALSLLDELAAVGNG